MRIYRPQFKCNYLKNEKHFPVFFFYFWNLHQILNILKKKRWSAELLYFRIYRLLKTFLEHSLKDTVSEHCLPVSMWKRPKLLPKEHESLWSYFFIILRQPVFENISLNYMSDLRGFSCHIESQWHESCSGLWEFVVPDSNEIILKTFSVLFLQFLESTSILNYFKTKD